MDVKTRKKKSKRIREEMRPKLRNCRVKRVDSRVRRVDTRNFEKRRKKKKEIIKMRRKLENVTM